MQNDDTAALATTQPVADAEVERMLGYLATWTPIAAFYEATHEIESAIALIRSLHARAVRAEAAAADERRDADRAHAELMQIANAMKNQFLDPPDGGDVSVIELVRRLDKAFTAAEAERDEARALLAEAAKALRPFSQKASAYDPAEDDDDDHAWSQLSTRGELRRARATLARLDGATGNPATEQDQGDR